MRIIPAIDIINGKCVRLTAGDYRRQKTYHSDPVEVAKSFQDAGIEYLHLVDLDGAKSGGIVNYKALERIATQTTLKIDFGGGVKTDADLNIAFSSGARQVTGGSIAVKQPSVFKKWLQIYGHQKIILGADFKNGKIATTGWLETSEEPLLPFVKHYLDDGVAYVICTDVAKDGMLKGPSFEQYEKLMTVNDSLKLIASGGISHIDQLYRLKDMGCEGVIIGKAIYEGFIDLKDLLPLL